MRSRIAGRFLSLLGALLLLGLFLQARPFTVVVYNVENLMDADGKAVYDQYQPKHYTSAHLLTKLNNTAEAIRRLGLSGNGPDILLLQEVEVDQTPSDRSVLDQLKPFEGRTVAELLGGSLPPEAADLPAEAWLLKLLEERGLKGYTVIAGGDSNAGNHEDGNRRAIKNVILTRFPVKEVRNHPTLNARNILEVLVDVDGHPLRVFCNHWKSGASSEETEPVRVENARVLRARLDEILKQDPNADIIIGGDLNSQYNQKALYPAMRRTGVNDELRSQGDERALVAGKADLYNLWYELPESARGSDTYQGEWGTLIHMIISRGLYDHKGVQYADGSFAVGRIPGLNTMANGTPMRWSSNGKSGSGFSDHFPIIALFNTVEDNDPNRWLVLENPSEGSTPSKAVRVPGVQENRGIADASKVAVTPPEGANLRDGSFNGKILRVEGMVDVQERTITVQFKGETWDVYIPQQELRRQLRRDWLPGSTVRFYGELGEFRGRWQFILRDARWLLR